MPCAPPCGGCFSPQLGIHPRAWVLEKIDLAGQWQVMAFGVNACAIELLLPPQVLGWAHTRKCNEIANEMRLVEISALDCKLRPIGPGLALRLTHGILEPPYATEQLRRQPDLTRKQLDETPLAQAD